MGNITKWLVYTVLFGAIPVIFRFIIYLVSTQPAPIVKTSDIICFGLIVVITNINHLEHQRWIDAPRKTVQMGISLFIALIFTLLYVAVCVDEINSDIFDMSKLTIGSGILAIGAVALSFFVVYQFSCRQGRSRNV